MDLLPDDLKGMKDLWVDPASRQKAKLVISEAATQVTDLTVKDLRDLFVALDQILLEPEDTTRPKADPAL